MVLILYHVYFIFICSSDRTRTCTGIPAQGIFRWIAHLDYVFSMHKNV
nr:MAG TPA: hypothetical protein [Bacteriophage sp.]